MKHSVKKFLSGLILLASGFLIHAESPTTIIPVPVNAELREGDFSLNPKTRILADKDLADTANLLAARLRTATGFAVKIKSADTKKSAGDIFLTTNGADPSLGAEGYGLSVTPGNVVIRATTTAGNFFDEHGPWP